MSKSKSKELKKSKKQEIKQKIEIKQIAKREEKQKKEQEPLDNFEELLFEEDFIENSPSLRRINSPLPIARLEEQAQEIFLEKDKKQEKGVYSERAGSIYDSKTNEEEKKDYNLSSNLDAGKRLNTEQDSNLLSRHGLANTSGLQARENNPQNDNKDREYVSEGKRLESNEHGLPFQQHKKDYRLR